MSDIKKIYNTLMSNGVYAGRDPEQLDSVMRANPESKKWVEAKMKELEQPTKEGSATPSQTATTAPKAQSTSTPKVQSTPTPKPQPTTQTTSTQSTTQPATPSATPKATTNVAQSTQSAQPTNIADATKQADANVTDYSKAWLGTDGPSLVNPTKGLPTIGEMVDVANQTNTIAQPTTTQPKSVAQPTATKPKNSNTQNDFFATSNVEEETDESKKKEGATEGTTEGNKEVNYGDVLGKTEVKGWEFKTPEQAWYDYNIGVKDNTVESQIVQWAKEVPSTEDPNEPFYLTSLLSRDFNDESIEFLKKHNPELYENFRKKQEWKAEDKKTSEYVGAMVDANIDYFKQFFPEGWSDDHIKAYIYDTKIFGKYDKHLLHYVKNDDYHAVGKYITSGVLNVKRRFGENAHRYFMTHDNEQSDFLLNVALWAEKEYGFATKTNIPEEFKQMLMRTLDEVTKPDNEGKTLMDKYDEVEDENGNKIEVSRGEIFINKALAKLDTYIEILENIPNEEERIKRLDANWKSKIFTDPWDPKQGVDEVAKANGYRLAQYNIANNPENLNSASEHLEELRKKANDDYRNLSNRDKAEFALNVALDGHAPGTPNAYDLYLMEKGYYNPIEQTKLAIRLREEAQDMAEDAKSDGSLSRFWEGLKAGATDADLWTGGLSSVADGFLIRDVMEKYNADKDNLTKEEEMLLDAFFTKLSVEAYTDRGIAYDVGRSIPESIGFMLSFLTSPTNGAARGLTRKFTKWAIKKYGTQYLRNNAIKYALGKGAAFGAGATLNALVTSTTTGAGHTARNISDKLTKSYDPNEDKFVGDKKPLTAIAEGLFETFNEVFVEEAGGSFLKSIFKPIDWGLGKISPTYNLSKELWEGFTNGKGFKQFKAKTGFNGTPIEFGEEILTDIANLPISNDTFDADEQTGIFGTRRMVTTAFSCLAIGTLMNMPNAVTYKSESSRIKRNVEQSNALGGSVFSREKWDGIKSRIDNASAGEIEGVVMSEMMNGKLNTTQKKAILKYAGARVQQDALLLRENELAMEAKASKVIDAQGTLNDKTNEGYNATDENEQRRMAILAQQSEQEVKAMLGGNEPEAMSALNTRYGVTTAEDLVAKVVNDESLTPEQRNTILNYINTDASKHAIEKRMADDANAQIMQAKREIDSYANEDAVQARNPNNVITAKLKEDDSQVYVIAGKVDVEDPKGSSESIVVFNPNAEDPTKQKVMTTPAQLYDVTKGNAQAMLDEKVSQIKAEHQRRLTQVTTGERTFEINQQITIPTQDGQGVQTATITNISPGKNGSPLITYTSDVDGTTSQVTIPKAEVEQKMDEVLLIGNAPSANEAPSTITAEPQINVPQAPVAEVEETKLIEVEDNVTFEVDGNQLQGVVASIEEGDGVAIVQTEDEKVHRVPLDNLTIVEETATKEQGGNNVEPTAETTNEGSSQAILDNSNEVEQNAPITPTESTPQAETPSESAPQGANDSKLPPLMGIPTDENGNKMYESASVEATINDIYNDPELDEEEADAYVQARIDGATQRIADLEAKKPKMGESKEAYIAERATWREELATQQASLDYWNGVQEARKNSTSSAESAEATPIETSEESVAPIVEGTEDAQEESSDNQGEKLSTKKKNPRLEESKADTEEGAVKTLEEVYRKGDEANKEKAKTAVLNALQDNISMESVDATLRNIQARKRRIGWRQRRHNAEARSEYRALKFLEKAYEGRSRELHAMDRFGKALGVTVQVVDQVDGGKANAKIVGNKVLIAKDAQQGIKEALAHELLHRIKALSPEAYETFAQAIEKVFANPIELANGRKTLTFEQMMVNMRMRYSSHRMDISIEGVREEVVADLAGMIMTDAELMERFVEETEGKKLYKQIWDTIKELLEVAKNVFRGQDHRNFVNAEKVLLEAMQMASEVQSNGNEERKEEKEKYSLIGERGAIALDRTEEATHRMDNLDMARKMERFDYPTKAIRMATGWERGADGKWRYEIDDDFTFDIDGNVDFGKRKPEQLRDYKRYKELLHKKNALAFEGKQLDAEEQVEFDDLVVIWKGTKLHNSTRLKDYIDHPELFEAYPELRDVSISFDNINARGEYNSSANEITLSNTLSPNEAKSTLIHEIQHAIQKIEGFARGGNVEASKNLIRERNNKALIWSFQKNISHMAKDNPGLSPLELIDKVLARRVELTGDNIATLEEQGAIPNEDGRIKAYNLWARGYDNEGYENAYNMVLGDDAYEVYRRHAGEVEARNVQSRMGMTPEQRRATLLAETEDVARKDQIFLRDNSGVSAMEEDATKTSIEKAVGGEMEVDGESVPTRFSIRSVVEGGGLTATQTTTEMIDVDEVGAEMFDIDRHMTDGDGNVIFTIGDKVFSGHNPVSVQDLKETESSLSMMVEDAVEYGTITKQRANEIFKTYADIINMYLTNGLAENGGYANLADKWLWVGETAYKTVSKNADDQYLTSLDITRVCKKNEAIIRAISEMQKRLGYGITPAQIMDLYLESNKQGYQVPCPVCYVFSRYLRNGRYATAIINGMKKYGKHLPGQAEEWTAQQWAKELEKQEAIKKNTKSVINLTNADIAKLLNEIDDLGEKLMKGNLTKKEEALIKKQILAKDAQYRAALNVESQRALTNWIKSFAIRKSNGEWVLHEDAQLPTDMKDFEEHALDLRKSAEAMRRYPGIQRLRNSGGSTSGKEVTFEGNNDLGEVISAVGKSSPEKAKNVYQEVLSAKTPEAKAKARQEAKNRFAEAVTYAQQQSLRGGQRMWSWSDNIEALSPDVAVNLIQMELLGGAVQTYSKQLEGINLVARMGAYVNGSLMAKDAGYAVVDDADIEIVDGKPVLKTAITETINEPTTEGVVQRTRTLAPKNSPIHVIDGVNYVLIFDDIVGIDPFGRDVNGKHMKGLFELNNELDKAGNIMVGMNDTHIKTAMADDRVFFIIPWHASGQSTHILKQMLNILGAKFEESDATDYTDMQSDKWSFAKGVPGKLIEMWNDTQFTNKECAFGGIETKEGGLTKQQVAYRELRNKMFSGAKLSKADLKHIKEDMFLSQVYEKLESRGLKEMTTKDKEHIYPYEYWDESSTYDNADVNGERYIEYCRRLGVRPKFSGKWGNEWSNTGDFTKDKGYWKLLIDRRMYDTKGEYQDLTAIDSKGFSTKLVDPEWTKQQFVVTKVADEQGTMSIVDAVLETEESRTGTIPQTDYELDMGKAVKDYQKARSNAEKLADTKYSLRSNAPFYSNAEYAVENIKQGKATPEQWLAMIQKNGGLKAGEDKWLGLSDWLKASDAKTLTKEEVLEFIKANQIVVEEVRYDKQRDFTLDAQAKKNLAEKWGQEFADRFARAFNVEYDEYDERAIATPVNAKEALSLYNEAYEEDWELGEDGTIPYEVIDDVEDWALTIAEGAMGDMRIINRTRLNYTTNGLENKREIALVVPSIDPYSQNDEIHFGDAGGGRAVAWVRFGETTDEDGNRVLVIDEIQSKRHQDGREKGYRGKDVAQRETRIAEIRERLRDVVARKKEIEEKIPKGLSLMQTVRYRRAMPEGVEFEQLRDEEIALRDELDEITLSMSERNAVPDAPFDKNWQELAMKRMLRYAAENGYDKVAWTTGEQQAERYDIGKVVDRVERDDDGVLVRTYNEDISIDFDENGKITSGQYAGNTLAEVFGKELATKIMSMESGEVLEEDGLRIGGEGMKGFYDKMLPSFMNKYGKKWGVKVGEVTMPELQDGYQTMHSIDVTDAMKESVMEGQPLFSLRGDVDARKVATDAVITSLEGSGIEVVRASDAEVEAVLGMANNLEFHIVYHGSGAKFDTFDHNHMGEGEGNQSYGWGTYVTEVEEVGKTYANVGDYRYEQLKAHVRMYDGYLRDASEMLDEAIAKGDEKEIAKAKQTIVELEQRRAEMQEEMNSINPTRHLYTIEIPDDNGSNYLNHDKVVPSKEIARVKQRLFDILSQGDYKGVERELKEELNGVFAPGLEGDILYNNVAAYLGGDKYASQFFNEMGYVGIKYPTNYMSGGNAKGQSNYVIFNETDAKIVDRVEFLKTPQGEVYGWTDGKKVYLTEKGMNPETPIHEYTHIWARAMAQKNAKGWQSVKDLLRGTPMWNEVMNDANYADIRENEDAVASEVLSRLSGKENAKRMESEAQRMIDEAKGVFAKAEAVTLIERMRKALNEFWSWVGKNLFDIKSFGSIEEVTDRVLYDLVNNTELETSEGVIEKQVVSDPKLIAELDASPKRIGYRNVVMNEDGTFGSPMASGLRNKGKGKVKTSSFAMGEWEQAEENPDLANENGKINLVKPDGKSVDQVDYNPYIHNRIDKVNAQFKQAWERPNLVYVETEIPLTDLESGYHADKAKLPVGIHSWSNGDLILSRYDKPVRIVPWEEVADDWVERFGDRGVEFDIVPPALLPILVERGVEILPPHKGMGKNCIEAYEEWKAEQNDTKYSLRSDDGLSNPDKVIAREAYERMVASGRYQFTEAMQDSMMGLKLLYKAILGKKMQVENIPDFENAYIAENLMSSQNAAMQQEYYIKFMKPLVKAINALGGKDKAKRQAIIDYLMAKHGLERNQVMAQRDAKATADEAVKAKYIGARNKAWGKVNKDLEGVSFATKEERMQARNQAFDSAYVKPFKTQAEEDAFWQPIYDEAFAENREKDYAGLTALTQKNKLAEAEAKAQEMVKNFETNHDSKEVDNLWERINGATKANLNRLRNGGVISNQQYNDTLDMYQYYIPLRGWDAKTSDEVYAYLTSKNTGMQGSTMKGAKGRKSKADDPIATIGAMADSAIREANRNAMKQRFLNFVLNHPSDLVSVDSIWLQYDDVTNTWIPVFADIKAEDTPDVIEQKLQEFNEKMQQLRNENPGKYKHDREAQNIPYVVKPGMDKEHQVMVKRNGQTYILTINGNPRAAQALNGLTNPDVDVEGVIGKLLKSAEWVNRQLSAFYTTRNPDFVVSNFARDMIYSNVMAIVKEPIGYSMRFHANCGVALSMLPKLIYKWEHGTLNMSNNLENMFYQFMINGGETGYTEIRDVEKHKRMIASELKKHKNVAKNAWHGLGAMYDGWNRSIENIARFAAFKTSREMGRTVQRSAYDAKEISVNFNKKGSGAKMLDAIGQTALGNFGAWLSGSGRLLWVFWNAGVQGATNFGKNVKRHPGMSLSMMTLMYALGVLLPMANDGDDEEKYYLLPEYVRRSNICFRVDDVWVTIPLPIEFRAMYGLGELYTAVTSGNEKLSDEELALAIAGQVSQTLPLDMLEGGGGLNAVIPSSVKPFIEAYRNVSWSGSPIHRDFYTIEEGKYNPQWTLAYPSTSSFLMNLTKTLNEWGGGDNNLPTKGEWWADWNPAKIEYVLKGMFGGLYSTANKLYKTVETIKGDRKFESKNIPLWNRVVKDDDPEAMTRKINNAYYDAIDWSAEFEDKYKKTKKLSKGSVEYASKLDELMKSDEYKNFVYVNGYKEAISLIRKRLNYEGVEISAEELNERILALKKEMVEGMDTFNKKTTKEIEKENVGRELGIDESFKDVDKRKQAISDSIKIEEKKASGATGKELKEAQNRAKGRQKAIDTKLEKRRKEYTEGKKKDD